MIRRKQIKRMAGCVMAVTMALTGVPVTAGTENINVEVVYADETLTYTEGNSTYTYTELSDGTLEISDYEGTDSEIVIPSQIQGKTVTEIGSYAFQECKSIQKIIIPKSIITIGYDIFYECSSLKEIIVEEENVNYKSEAGVLFNKDMTKLIKYPVEKEDTKYILPDSATMIEAKAFFGCSSLEKIEISEGVITIDVWAFGGCSNLKEIVVDEDNVNYKSEAGVLFNKDMTELKKYPPKKQEIEYLISDKVTTIGNDAFEGCCYLEKIVVPDSVTTIGNDAFFGCSSLEKIEIADSITTIGYGAFWGCSSLKQIEIPDNVTEIEDNLFEGCSSLEKIEIPNSVTMIGNSAFKGCISLENIEIPSSVTTIENDAFFGCSSLKKIEIPEGVTKINMHTFYGCISLENIEIPDSVTTIVDSAFSGCSALEKIEIPKNVRDIGDYTFSGCNSLKEIIVDEDNANYKSKGGVLFNKDMTRLIVYPVGKEGIEYIIPDSVTMIGCGAFHNSNILEKIEISEAVMGIEYWAFCGCNSLKEIIVDEDNMNYKAEEGVLFNKDMTRLIVYPKKKEETKYIIPESVTMIDSRAFESVKESLRKIEIPESVTMIGWMAFNGIDDSLIIQGKKSSYAETYANENSITFIAINEITSSDDVSIIYQVNDMEEIISLQTKKLTQEDEEYKNIDLEDKIVDSEVTVEELSSTVYAISIVDENNKEVKNSQVVTVKIPCPQDYVGSNCKVYIVNSDKTFTNMDAQYNNGYIIFDTDELGMFIITETELKEREKFAKGDTNKDGEIDIKDSALIKRYLAGWDVELNLETADVNGDGEVTIKDSALIKRYLAGWDVEFVAD